MKYLYPNFEREWQEAKRYPEFRSIGKDKWIDFVKENSYISNYNKISKYLGNVDLDFNNLEDIKKERFKNSFKLGKVETPIAVKFSNTDYDLVAGNTRLAGLIKKGLNPKIWVIKL